VRPLLGMGGDKLLPTVVPGLSEQEGMGQRIAQRRREVFLSTYVQTLRPAPGSRDLVRHLADMGLRLVVASSAKREELAALLQAAQVADLLTETTTSDDADDSKPAPDIVQVALRKLGMPPTDAVMLGDTPYDIESAGKAGVRTIAFRCGGSDDTRLRGACAIFDDPADLLAHYVSSPLGEGLREHDSGDPHANQSLGA
jgi:HAD superfamily hydrolase (TIGR01509 family)